MNTPLIRRFWRQGLLLLLAAGSLVLLLSRPPFGQDPQYHDFADQRAWLGIPHFWNVVSNLPFLFVGGTGLWLLLRKRCVGGSAAWNYFFGGVLLVTAGSAYYHWRPCNETLVWDRLPMTIGFMAMFTALLSESLHERFGRMLLLPALLVGLGSVLYWHWFDDLRFYAWVQFMPLLLIPLLLVLFRGQYSHRGLVFLALGCYVLAKVFEVYDHEVFDFTKHIFAGHAVKHLLAAASCLVILEMLRRRRANPPELLRSK